MNICVHNTWENYKDSLNYLAVNSFTVKDQGKSVLKYIFPQEVAFYAGEFSESIEDGTELTPASGYGFVWGVVEADLT